jgi:Uma2 family endonuclease
MKAVMSSLLPDVLAYRKMTGADQWDEMWDGVLHMVPSPNREHQDLEGAIETWLRRQWAPRTGGRVYHQINIARPGTWPKDYRIPDLVLLSPERAAIDKNEYFEGGPDVVVEIRSPDDESLEKLGFYFEVGVREVWMVDRDTRSVELLLRGDAGWVTIAVGRDGHVSSPFAGVEFRPSTAGKLELRITVDPGTAELVP